MAAAGFSPKRSRTEPDRAGVNDPGPGRRLALDIGSVRIGVAVSDSQAHLATPVETVRRVTQIGDPDSYDIDRICDLIADYEVVELVIGLPRDLRGNGSVSAQNAEDMGLRLKRALLREENAARVSGQEPRPVAIRYADERLTTVVATRALRSSGVTAKKGRAVVDQAAAVAILQDWLDERRAYLSRSGMAEGG